MPAVLMQVRVLWRVSQFILSLVVTRCQLADRCHLKLSPALPLSVTGKKKPCHHVSLQVHSVSEAFPEVRHRALGKTNLDWIVLIAFKLESCCFLSRRGNRLLRQRRGVTCNPALRAMEESICFNMVYSSRNPHKGIVPSDS